MVHHPNFPPNLDIAPSVGDETLGPPGDDRDAFGAEAQREAIARYGIAGRVWEAAYALCAYVDDDDDAREFDPPFADLRAGPLGVLELGSGTGVVAARVAKVVRRRGGFVIATDLPDVCPLLRRNLVQSRSGGASVSVRPLAWGDPEHAASFVGARRLTHILCSDLVYFPELFGPLLRTLIHLTTSSSPIEVVVSYKIRSLTKETPFWSAFGLWFSFRPVLARRRGRPGESENDPPGDERDAQDPWRPFGADEETDRTFVFVAHRRPESITWQVPETDKELMAGVGARNTTAKKGDDTFETILLMCMGIDDTRE